MSRTHCFWRKFALRLWLGRCSAREKFKRTMRSFFILLVLTLAPSALLADVDPIRLPPTRPAAPAAVTAAPATATAPAKSAAPSKAKKHAKKHGKKKHKAP